MLRNLVVELTLRAPAGWRHAAAPRARGRDFNGAGRGNERSRPHAMTIPLDDQGCPDLQALVRLRGKQYAESIGEKYDPEHCPHHGGYQHVATNTSAPRIGRSGTAPSQNGSIAAALGLQSEMFRRTAMDVTRWRLGDVAERLLGGRKRWDPPPDWTCWAEPAPALPIDARRSGSRTENRDCACGKSWLSAALRARTTAHAGQSRWPLIPLRCLWPSIPRTW